MKIVSFLAQTVLPVDLVRQRIPCEATYRNTGGPKIHDVTPLLVEPRHRVLLDSVRLAMEERNLVSRMILRG